MQIATVERPSFYENIIPHYLCLVNEWKEKNIDKLSKKYSAIFGFLVDIFVFLSYNYKDIARICRKERKRL